MKNIWLNYDTLMAAFNSAKERKGYHNSVLRYEANLSENLESLLGRLASGEYRPRPYREFYVYDPKVRLIQAPHFEDRIVHHAVILAVRRQLDAKLIFDTYACRVGKGTQAASKRLLHFIRSAKGEGYALKLDVKKFFYSVDHERVDAQLRKYLACEETINLIGLFYRNETGKGLPLGNVTSQMLANLALNPVDQFIKRELKIKGYVRYMDDMVLLHPDQEYLRECAKLIGNRLAEENLQLNNRTRICKLSAGVPFVGYRHFISHRVLKPATIHKFRRVLAKTTCPVKSISYLAFAKDSGSYHAVKDSVIKLVPGAMNKVVSFTIKHKQLKAA